MKRFGETSFYLKVDFKHITFNKRHVVSKNFWKAYENEQHLKVQIFQKEQLLPPQMFAYHDLHMYSKIKLHRHTTDFSP